MARPEQLFVFSYDVSRDGPRARLHAMLSEYLTPVQRSVFEGRLTTTLAARLGRKGAAMLGPDDSLRVYCVTEAGRRMSVSYGPTPLAEAQDFYLL